MTVLVKVGTAFGTQRELNGEEFHFPPNPKDLFTPIFLFDRILHHAPVL